MTNLRNDIEIWKDIFGYEGYYQISNFGRIKSLMRKGRLTERMTIGNINTGGYRQVAFCKKSIVKFFLVNRLVGICFIPNPDNLPEINHKDGDKENNNAWNLEWSSSSNNKIHAIALGLSKPPIPGKSGGKIKLKKVDVLNIRERLKNGDTGRAVAQIYQLKEQTISCIKNRRTWKNL